MCIRDRDKDVLMMANHGTLVVAPTMHVAFDDTVYLERTCMYQMLALNSVGGNKAELAQLDKEAMARTESYYTKEMIDKYAVKHFYSWWNQYVNEKSNVFE